ncbi:MAG TPA: hypothetical protein PLL33_08900 [Paracoccus sp. (in: a-proteobacteria)]|nr:hypothetical protein [Paracoccus sp. (in: a-proteobacteria)]
MLFDRAALGLTSRTGVLAACINSGGNVIVDLGANELVVRDINLTSSATALP